MEEEGLGSERKMLGDFTESKKKRVFHAGEWSIKWSSKARLENGYVSVSECKQWEKRALSYHPCPPGVYDLVRGKMCANHLKTSVRRSLHKDHNES